VSKELAQECSLRGSYNSKKLERERAVGGIGREKEGDRERERGREKEKGRERERERGVDEI
jgi:hypothetical protein